MYNRLQVVKKIELVSKVTHCNQGGKMDNVPVLLIVFWTVVCMVCGGALCLWAVEYLTQGLNTVGLLVDEHRDSKVRRKLNRVIEQDFSGKEEA
jgi:hypothetical protein